ncbi:hypothetical protein BN2497_14409 [Janthinobacterium sp. CG23_2]|nr:hypothetical protein BN2497_14409 [Janthinobacterium sp. CG23_2]CUU33602.1 hypothetical protein BN3177_14409 [Janthinobacterium sp. CG23_2]
MLTIAPLIFATHAATADTRMAEVAETVVPAADTPNASIMASL